jgi:exonuclease III
MDQKARKSHDKWKRNNKMFIPTWNVHSLYQPGASRMLEEELEKYKVDIAAIQEIQWKSTEIVELNMSLLTVEIKEMNVVQVL